MKLIINMRGGAEFRKNDISFLLHGLLQPAVGAFAELPGLPAGWLRFEIVVPFARGDVYESLNSLPNEGDTIARLTFESNDGQIKRQFKTEGDYSIKCLSITDFQIQYGQNAWKYGVWMTFCFHKTGAGAEFTLGADENGYFQTNSRGGVIPDSGVEVSLGDGPSESLFDLLRSGHAFQHVKRSSNNNSLVQLALDVVYKSYTGPDNPQLELTYQRSGQDLEGGYAQVAAGFMCKRMDGYIGPVLQRIHFMEAFGIFKGISVPAPHHFKNPNSDILKNPGFWSDNMIEIIEANYEAIEGQEFPHEIVTLVLS